MPSIVGSFKVVSVSSGSVVLIGDTLQVAPASTSKTFAGAGSFNTGDLAHTNNAISATNTSDNDIQDSTQTSNGNKGVNAGVASGASSSGAGSGGAVAAP